MSSSTERKRLQRQRDREDPERKHRKLDTIYMFGEVEISVIVDNEQNIWFKAVDLARALEMEDPNNSIYNVLDKKYCKSYEILSSLSAGYCDIPNIHPKTTFVNEIGMNMYIMRSNKPKALQFAEWVCGEVLPSIRKTNKYEVDPANNPYRELNDYLQKQIEDLKNETIELKNKTIDLKTENSDLKIKTTCLESTNTNLENMNTHLKNMNTDLRNMNIDSKNENMKLIGDLSKYTQKLFEMKPSCVPTLNNEAKREYFVLYRKDDPQNYKYPYYACRVQLHSLELRRNKLLKEYPKMEKLLELSVPNSVTFFNFIREQMPDYIERGDGQSFRIKDISEEEMLIMIENLYRSLHGALKK